MWPVSLTLKNNDQLNPKLENGHSFSVRVSLIFTLIGKANGLCPTFHGNERDERRRKLSLQGWRKHRWYPVSIKATATEIAESRGISGPKEWNKCTNQCFGRELPLGVGIRSEPKFTKGVWHKNSLKGKGFLLQKKYSCQRRERKSSLIAPVARKGLRLGGTGQGSGCNSSTNDVRVNSTSLKVQMKRRGSGRFGIRLLESHGSKLGGWVGARRNDNFSAPNLLLNCQVATSSLAWTATVVLLRWMTKSATDPGALGNDKSLRGTVGCALLPTGLGASWVGDRNSTSCCGVTSFVPRNAHVLLKSEFPSSCSCTVVSSRLFLTKPGMAHTTILGSLDKKIEFVKK